MFTEFTVNTLPELFTELYNRITQTVDWDGVVFRERVTDGDTTSSETYRTEMQFVIQNAIDPKLKIGFYFYYDSYGIDDELGLRLEKPTDATSGLSYAVIEEFDVDGLSWDFSSTSYYRRIENHNEQFFTDNDYSPYYLMNSAYIPFNKTKHIYLNVTSQKIFFNIDMPGTGYATYSAGKYLKYVDDTLQDRNYFLFVPGGIGGGNYARMQEARATFHFVNDISQTSYDNGSDNGNQDNPLTLFSINPRKCKNMFGDPVIVSLQFITNNSVGTEDKYYMFGELPEMYFCSSGCDLTQGDKIKLDGNNYTCFYYNDVYRLLVLDI